MPFSGVTAAPLGLQGAMVGYLVTDALEEDAGSRFRRGDEVRFKASHTRCFFTSLFKFVAKT